MSVYLAFVTHDIVNNTLEATWLEPVTNSDGELQELRRARCRNYSADQKADFIADCGEGADKYTTLAGW